MIIKSQHYADLALMASTFMKLSPKTTYKSFTQDFPSTDREKGAASLYRHFLFLYVLLVQGVTDRLEDRKSQLLKLFAIRMTIISSVP